MRWSVALHVTGLILVCVGMCMLVNDGLVVVLVPGRVPVAMRHSSGS